MAGELLQRVGKMTYKYNPRQFWSSVDTIKSIRDELERFHPQLREEIIALLYRAMEETRKACIATVEHDEGFPRNSCERDMETDRKALEEILASFRQAG